MHRPEDLHSPVCFPLLTVFTEGAAVSSELVSLRLFQCSEKPLQSQMWANSEKFTFTGKTHLPSAGWKGWSVYYGTHCWGRWKTCRTNHLSPPRPQKAMPHAACPGVWMVAAIQLPPIPSHSSCCSWACSASEPNPREDYVTNVQELFNNINPQS